MIKAIVYDFIYVIINYFIAYIPCWTIRKALYLMAGLKIGKGSRICMRAKLLEPWNIVIGESTIINDSCVIDGRGKLSIGSNCSISEKSIIYTASHLTNSELFEYYEKRTIIGDGVWIGVRATILPGALIDNYAVIGAHSVVTEGEYKSSVVYAGIPAKKIKDRNITRMEKLNHIVFFR